MDTWHSLFCNWSSSEDEEEGPLSLISCSSGQSMAPNSVRWEWPPILHSPWTIHPSLLPHSQMRFIILQFNMFSWLWWVLWRTCWFGDAEKRHHDQLRRTWQRIDFVIPPEDNFIQREKEREFELTFTLNFNRHTQMRWWREGSFGKGVVVSS